MPDTPWRRNMSTGTTYEERVGYSRAVRAGNQVFVAGTTALRDGQVVGVGDPAAQTRRILEIIGGALAEVGAAWTDVIRYRVYVVDIAHSEAVGEVLGETFRGIRPVSTLVAVRALVDPEMLVEIDLDAIIPPET